MRAARRLGQAEGHRETEPDARGGAGAAEPLEGHGYPVPVRLGDARPAVDHTQLNPVAAGAGRQQRRQSAGRVPQCVSGHVRDDPFHDHRIDMTWGSWRGMLIMTACRRSTGSMLSCVSTRRQTRGPGC